MFENDVNKAYLVYKGVNSIIFGENYKSNFELVTAIFNLDTYKTLCMLHTIVTNYRSILDEKMKDNICRLVNYYRYDVKTFSQEDIDNQKKYFEEGINNGETSAEAMVLIGTKTGGPL